MLQKTMENIENIKKVLKENKRGLWLERILYLTKVPKGSIRYLIYGQKKKEKVYGGYLIEQVELIREGRNLKVKIKN